MVVLQKERTFGVAYGETLSSDFGVLIVSASSPVGARAERQQLWILPDFSMLDMGFFFMEENTVSVIDSSVDAGGRGGRRRKSTVYFIERKA